MNNIPPYHFEGLYAKRGIMTTHDARIMEITSLPFKLLITEKGSKSFYHRRHYLVTPSLMLYQEQFQGGIHIIGTPPANMLTMSIPLKLGNNTAYWNRSIKENSLPFTLPGELNTFFDEGQSHLILSIDLKFIRKHFSAMQLKKIKEAENHHFILSSTRKIRRFSAWLQKMLRDTLNDVSILSDEVLIRLFEDELVEHLKNTLAVSQTEERRDPVSHRMKGLKKALEFINDSDTSFNSIVDICDAAHVSQRTLEYAFQDAYNLSPIAFIKKQRLHYFHHKLLMSPKKNNSVMKIANEFQFFQPGRLAAEYEKIFKELPSRTLNRDTAQLGLEKRTLAWK